MSTVLEQTKGKIKLVGKVQGIKNENSKREGFTKSDAQYKSISFFVQTSETNRVKVELFGMEREHVYAYSRKAQQTKKIAWANRHDNHDDYKVMGVQASLTKGGDGKYVRKVLPEFDAVDFIYDNLKDGDVVRVNGEIDFQQFTDSEGNEKESTRFSINGIYKTDDELDFTAEDFKEEAIFEQEIVVIDKEVDSESKKLIVNAKIIKYGGDSVDTTLVVDAIKYPKLANNMAKRFNFGDFIKVYGLILNQTIVTEATAEDAIEDEDDWGGDDEIKQDFSTSYIRDYIQELQITSVDSSTYEPKKYNEEDFESEEEDIFNGDIDGEEDPFASDDDNGEEEEIDDLPF